jgi:hypothetical protein
VGQRPGDLAVQSPFRDDPMDYDLPGLPRAVKPADGLPVLFQGPGQAEKTKVRPAVL